MFNNARRPGNPSFSPILHSTHLTASSFPRHVKNSKHMPFLIIHRPRHSPKTPIPSIQTILIFPPLEAKLGKGECAPAGLNQYDMTVTVNLWPSVNYKRVRRPRGWGEMRGRRLMTCKDAVTCCVT